MSFKPSHVDVLIIGAGPAGSMLAATLSRTGLSTRIIDKRNDGVIAGQADGINKRSMELFQSLGLANKIMEQGDTLSTSISWGPKAGGGIERKRDAGILQSTFAELDGHALNQGHIEKIIQSSAKEFGDIEVERGVLPVSMKIDEAKADDVDAYAVEVVVQHLQDDESSTAQMRAYVKRQDHTPGDGLYRSNIGPTDHTEQLLKKVSGRKPTEETIRAKYVVGCDGAWSWTRHQLGLKLEGASRDFIWGVMDIIPITDFPDARDVNWIQSENGSILWIAREHGLVRIYTQLTEVKPGEDGAVDRSKITPDQIFEQAQKVMQPYKIDYRYCDWWTAYQVGQRVGEAYSDPSQRVFLAGDAVHTHSPKEGQGMNTSMQDTYNLGWKLAAVVNKQSPRSLLATYETERRPLAQALIEADRKISAAFSGKATGNLVQLYEEQAELLPGFNVNYPGSSIVAKPIPAPQSHVPNGVNGAGATNGATPKEPSDLTTAGSHPAQEKPVKTSFITASSPLQLGRRLPPYTVYQHSGATPRSLLAHAPFDGRWHLFVLAANVESPTQLSRVNALGAALSDPKTGPLRVKHTLRLSSNVPFPYAMHTEAGRAVQARQREVPLLHVVTVHASPRGDRPLGGKTEMSDFHDAFWPMDESLGRAYKNINRSTDLWEKVGVSRETGCLVLVRPDQYVAWMGEVDDVDGLRKFWDGVML